MPKVETTVTENRPSTLSDSPRTVAGTLASMCCVTWSTMAVVKYGISADRWFELGRGDSSLPKYLEDYPEVMAFITGLATYALFYNEVNKWRNSNRPLLSGLGEMQRADHRPRPTPRLEYDVNTGLPNHRATNTTPTYATALPGWADPTASEAGINISERLAFENIGELTVNRGVIWKDV